VELAVEKLNFRFVRVNGNIYARKEDVIECLLEFAATEETDVRNRLEKMAANIGKLGVEEKK
jgi:hypothetical protein